ncbi:MAG: hypothetical protein JRH16_08085 [Deltaproteobacteria bacterium]|nr:hypothetical protein [Deltaproteobacteria bacterium]
MRIATRLGNGLGLLALAASFALASPGVNVVRADTVAAQPARSQCQAAGERDQRKDPEVAAFLERLRAARVQPAASDDPSIVILNNRGYNYGSARGIDLDAVLAEVDARR